MEERRCRPSSLAPRQGGPGDVEPAVRVLPRLYLTLAYQYDAGDGDVWPDAMAEFFMDWLDAEGNGQTTRIYAVAAPPSGSSTSLLSEKGYLDDPEPIMAGSPTIEPDFIALVQQRS